MILYVEVERTDGIVRRFEITERHRLQERGRFLVFQEHFPAGWSDIFSWPVANVREVRQREGK